MLEEKKEKLLDLIKAELLDHTKYVVIKNELNGSNDQFHSFEVNFLDINGFSLNVKGETNYDQLVEIKIGSDKYGVAVMEDYLYSQRKVFDSISEPLSKLAKEKNEKVRRAFFKAL